MRIAVDTNVLVYASGVNDLQKQDRVLTLLAELEPYDIVLSVQVLSEFFRVLTGKAGFSRTEAAVLTRTWMLGHTVFATHHHVLENALELATRHRLSIWDSIVLASSVAAQCQILLSEDMHHGFNWSGVTIVNPFAEPRHYLLDQALGR